MFAKESKIELEIYVDEIEPELNCNYITIGALFVPSNNKKTIFAQLLNVRCLNKNNNKWYNKFDSCPIKDECKEEWHNMNNVEVHFTDIRDSRVNKSLIEISKSWLKQFSSNNKKNFVNILCIDLDNLDSSFFGDESKKANIYNKFFRTVIDYGLKTYFSKYGKIIIKNIFYDKKEELERHYFFNYRNLEKLSYESSKNIEFANKIVFVNSDHKEEEIYPDESHFIQLIDLIIGAIRHNIFRISDSKKKDEVARKIRHLLNKLRQKYFDSSILRVSFFPKNKIQKVKDLFGKDSSLRKDEFYHLDRFNFKLAEQSTTLKRWL